MSGSRLVSTLAVLILANGLAANDSVAPVITLLDSDIQPTVPSISRSDSNPASLFSSTVLQNDLYLYNGSAPLGYRWEEFDSNTAGITSAGIAIVLADTRGTWQYSTDGGTSWTSIDQSTPLSDTNAFLLSTLTATDLRFVPNPSLLSDGDMPKLVFRAWDGSAGTAGSFVNTTHYDGSGNTLAGGSPTAFSAEQRTIQVQLFNTAPDITDTLDIGTTVSVHAGEWFYTGFTISDPDGDATYWSNYTTGSGSGGYGSADYFFAGYAPGSYDATFIASDDFGSNASLTVTFTVTNIDPVISDPSGAAAASVAAPIDIVAYGTYDIAALAQPLTASDGDGDTLTWSGSTANGSVSGSTYTAGGAPGLCTVDFTTSDGLGGSATTTFHFNVSNTAPTIVDAQTPVAGTTIQIHAGDTIDLTNLGVSVNEPDVDDPQNWTSGYTTWGYWGFSGGLTYTAGSNSAGQSETVTFSLSDGYHLSVDDAITVTFSIIAPTNLPPQYDSTIDGLIDSEGYYFNVGQGGRHTFTVHVTDPNGDAIDWRFYNNEGLEDPNYGVLTALPIDRDGNIVFTYAQDGSMPYYGDYFNLEFYDTNGASATLYINVNVTPNTLPYIATQVPQIAVRGQPYSALVTIQDDDANDPLTLTLAGVAITPITGTVDYLGSTQRTYRVEFTPNMPGTVRLAFTSADGIASNQENVDVDVADPPVEAITSPTVPVSTAGNPIYAAVAPGSVAGWSSLMGALAPHPADIARAWWWSTSSRGFYDAEVSAVSTSRQPSTALFLASTVALTYSFDAKPYPMPFAIDLPPAMAQATGAGADGWTFFGVPALWDGSSTALSHSLGDFVLETADGRRVSDDAEILNALAPALATTVQEPWGYDPAQPSDSRYQPASSLSTGAGYWIRNRSTTAYRLVRVGAEDSGGIRLSNVVDGGGQVLTARPAAARAAEKPPAPPSGSTATGKASAAGGCGVGSLAGLLIAGFALIGLRNRRRI